MAGKKLSNTLLTLSSAAILAVYAAGFERTAPAAARFEAQTIQRLTTMPAPPSQPGQTGMLAGPGTYQPPAALPLKDAAPVAQHVAPEPVAVPQSTPTPLAQPAAQMDAQVETAPAIPQSPAPESTIAAAVPPAVTAPLNESAAAVTASEPGPPSSAPAPVEAPAETTAPVIIAALTPEPAPAPPPEAPPAAVETAPAPAPIVSAPVNEPLPADKRSEPVAKAPKAPKPPKQPKVAKSDLKQVPPPAVQPAPQPAPPAAPAPVTPPAPVLQDGTYYGWGSSRHGDIQAEVVIQNGRIASATIAQCETRYPCSIIEKAPPQVAQRQSAAVDVIAGATESIYAFYYAVLDALSKAR